MASNLPGDRAALYQSELLSPSREFIVVFFSTFASIFKLMTTGRTKDLSEYNTLSKESSSIQPKAVYSDAELKGFWC